MNKKNKKKKIIWGSLLSVVVLIVVIVIVVTKKSTTTVVTETVTISKGNIVNAITATGTIEPISSVEVGTQVSGTIANIYVDYNSEVKKGQLLAELDKTVLESELKSQQTNLASAKNEMDYQQKNFARIKELYERQAVSQTDYEDAEYKYKNACYAYERLKLQVVTAQKNLSYATITSPIDGVVLSRAVDEGQTVAASFNTPTLFTIANDLTKMQVIVDIDEADIGQVKEGQRVEFTVDAFPDDVFEGEVTQVRLEAKTTSNVVTYSVVVQAPNPDLKLMPGLTANVSVFTMEINDVLVLPSKAMRFSPDVALMKKAPKPSKKPEGMPDKGQMNENMPANANKEPQQDDTKKMIWLQEGEDMHPQRVKVGKNNGTEYEVIEGLKEGDKVVVSMKEVSVQEKKQETNTNNPFMPGPRPGDNRKK